MITPNERLNPAAAALAVLVVVLWGLNSVSIKIALQALPPLLTAGIRFLLSLPVIFAWARLGRIPLRLGPGEAKKIFPLTLLFVIQIYLMYAGTNLTLASRSALLISAYPIFTAVFAHFLVGDRLDALRISGMALAFGGAALIFAEGIRTGSLTTLAGDAMVLLSGMVVGFRLVHTKKLTQEISPARLLFWQALLSVPLWFLLSAGLEKPAAVRLNGEILAALLYQGLVVAGFCFSVWIALLRRHSASGLTVFAFLSPLSGVAAGSLILAEPLSPFLLAGLALIASGIALVNRRSARRAQRQKKGFPEKLSGKPD